MKKGWETRKLGAVATLQRGFDLPTQDRIAGEYPLISSSGRIDTHGEYAVRGPGVVTGRSGSIGKVFFVEQDFWPLNTTLYVKDFHGNDPKFIFYLLQKIELQRFAGGSGVPTLNRNLVHEELVALPSLSNQQRIAGILDKAYEALAIAQGNTRKNIKNAHALFDSHLQSVFTRRDEGWVRMTLDEVATTFGRGKSKHRPRNAPHLYGGKYPFVQTGDIRNANHVVMEYTQTYSEAGLTQSKLWPKGTLCITIAANIAETAILGFDACFPDSVIGLVADPTKADVGFIEYLLQFYKARIQAMGKGSAQANINLGTFENERFPFPAVSEQKRIVEHLDGLAAETQCLARLYEKKEAALEALRQSLLHQALSGELK